MGVLGCFTKKTSLKNIRQFSRWVIYYLSLGPRAILNGRFRATRRKLSRIFAAYFQNVESHRFKGVGIIGISPNITCGFGNFTCGFGNHLWIWEFHRGLRHVNCAR